MEAPPVTPAPEPEPPADTSAADLEQQLSGLDFDDMLATATAAIARRDPEDVVASGLADILDLEGVILTDISAGYRNTTVDMWEVIRQRLAEFDPLSLTASQALSHDILGWQAQQAISSRRFMHFDYQASYFLTSVPRQTQRFFSDLHPLESRQDARDYLARLALVGEKFGQLIENLRRAEQRGVIEPAITLPVSIATHQAVLDAPVSSNPYYQRFSSSLRSIPGLSDEDMTAFRDEARSLLSSVVNPAYQDLLAFMRDQQDRAPAAIGVGQFDNGDAYYRQRLAFHTSTTLTPEEVHEIGLQEVARLQTEMRNVFDTLGYPADETLEALFQRVATDGGTVLAAESISVYERLIEDAQVRMQGLFKRLPETEVQVIGGDNGGFYIAASLDGSRPGAFYAGTSFDQPYYLMPTLAYHEAMPGHHMQIALAQETDLPLFRRQARFTAYIEGWALYAERLASDYDWYAGDLFGDIGRLYFENLRAVRLVVDTGIHHYGWSFERAVDYFQQNVGSSRRSAESNVGRYMLYTGQATAYMVGMLKILELREQAREALGDAFSIADFHELVLDQGAMPLEVLVRRVSGALPETP